MSGGTPPSEEFIISELHSVNRRRLDAKRRLAKILPLEKQAKMLKTADRFYCLADADGTSAFPAVWQGFTLEHWRLRPMEAPDAVSTQYQVAAQISPPLLVEWKERGRFIQSRLLPGDISLIACGETGAYRWREGEAELLVCVLETEFVRQVCLDDAHWRNLEFKPLKGRQDAQVVRLLQCLNVEKESGYPGGRLFGEYLASALIAHLTRHYAAFSGKLPAFAERIDRQDLRVALEYIHDNLSRDLGLPEIAGAACLSVSQFSRLFKQATGQAPHDYVIQTRIERAKTLLRRREISIAQIAAETGFYDSAHFLRHFKRQTGVTPKQMRESLLS